MNRIVDGDDRRKVALCGNMRCIQTTREPSNLVVAYGVPMTGFRSTKTPSRSLPCQATSGTARRRARVPASAPRRIRGAGRIPIPTGLAKCPASGRPARLRVLGIGKRGVLIAGLVDVAVLQHERVGDRRHLHASGVHGTQKRALSISVRDDIARRMNISARTIDRSLKKENLQFRSLSQKVRFERARTWRSRRMAASRVAEDLGFSATFSVARPGATAV